jgi:DNA mismatch repair protein MutH
VSEAVSRLLQQSHYDKMAKEDWSTSTFWKKNKDLLIVFYVHQDNVSVLKLKVVLAGRWNFPEEDLIIIQRDWATIQRKILEGKAHEISEGDTLYLGACTKGSSSLSTRRQPFSSIPAKQRALSLKQSYVDSIIERMGRRTAQIDRSDLIVKDPDELRRRTFEDIVLDRFAPYLGKSTDAIAKELGIAYGPNVKNYNDLMTRRILGVKDKVLEFKRANITIRSIKLEADGRLVESVSFPAFDPIALSKEDDWDESSVKEMFERRFFFVVYQLGPDGTKYLKRVLFWTIPHKDLQEVRKVWATTVERIRQGRYEDLPKIKDNPVSHIRPHGRNAQDKVIAPDGSMVRKQCFWLNAKYVAEQVGAERYVDLGQSKLPSGERGSIIIR